MTNSYKHTNRLIHSLSPYLQQHAHNPVDWFEWNDEAWQKAKDEDKLVLVSIGYSSCHWCHVMEKESFENEDTAAIMNEYFVCIKVDREERPDIDQVYMDAVQLISGHGGWPLNMFCLPDGRPLHGGTYFPNLNWNQMLFQLEDLYRNKKETALDYAEKLTTGVREMEVVTFAQSNELQATQLEEVYNSWSKSFDWKNGGNARTPKFPLPNNFLYLLDYGILSGKKEAIDFTAFTLRKMAMGGIYDQLGGGFARYSVDAYWLAPHFEKMLYDNGQLLSLYAKMQAVSPDPLFLKTIHQTIQFVRTELSNGEGAFYSSYDADSEGMEGKFYVWQWEELKTLLGDRFDPVLEYYRCTPEGNWEHGWNILHTAFSPEEFAALKGLNAASFKTDLEEAENILLQSRLKRVKPGLDDKIILCWNALMLEGLCHCYATLREPEILEMAEANANFLIEKMLRGDELLRIYKDGNAAIPAFLEDYGALCSALIELYKITFNEKYLDQARMLADTVIRNFYDAESGLFFFASSLHESLVARKKDLADDVISSGNSMMINNLRNLYFYDGKEEYRAIVEKMATSLRNQFVKYASWYSNWGRHYLSEAFGTIQLAATGVAWQQLLSNPELNHFPGIVLAGAEKESSLEILKGRFLSESAFFVCQDETCHPPCKTLDEALELIHSLKQNPHNPN